MSAELPRLVALHRPAERQLGRAADAVVAGGQKRDAGLRSRRAGEAKNAGASAEAGDQAHAGVLPRTRGLPRVLLEVDDPGAEAGAEPCEPLPKLGRSHVAAFRLPLKLRPRSAKRREPQSPEWGYWVPVPSRRSIRPLAVSWKLDGKILVSRSTVASSAAVIDEAVMTSRLGSVCSSGFESSASKLLRRR